MSKRPVIHAGFEELTAWCAQRGERSFRARQVWEWLFARRATEFAQMTDISSSLRLDLDAHFLPFSSRVEAVRQTADETRKLLVLLADSHTVECVLMSEGKRRTVCVSTQVGCGMGCVFCASGLDGVRRNLDTHEIVEQFLHARNSLPPAEHLTHAVIMGMGEPLANLNNLLDALEIVCRPDGLNLGQRHVTISTVGLPSRIRQLADARKGYHLAVSLHAPDDRLRNQLVPTNTKTGIGAIVSAADYFARRSGRQVTYEYVLLRDINDSPQHASRLSGLLQARRAHINLIPYNPVPGLPYGTPRSESVKQFRERLSRSGLSVKVRKTKGRRIDAACGQLRLSQRPAGSAVRAGPPTALDLIQLHAAPPRPPHALIEEDRGHGRYT
jgi:23S rRNA (adenine2503-C2)-methyltransferase